MAGKPKIKLVASVILHGFGYCDTFAFILKDRFYCVTQPCGKPPTTE